MCGICGVIGIGHGDEAEIIVRRMLAALRHRGPDDEGLLVAPLAAFGTRRLSIIDLAGGHQPVFNERGDVAVVLNGEIYNFQELRQMLKARGHFFRTRSDTESVVHAYEEWGEDCVHRLRGMFAFAVLDGREGSDAAGPRVFLARDRLGIKPLYYARVNGVFLFASEVRALLAAGQLSPCLSRPALESYLLFGSVSEPMTLVDGVYSLPPGHCLSFPQRAIPSNIVPKSYWSFADTAGQHEQTQEINPKTVAERLRQLVADAVRSHLVADVPLGIFLSSGVDSTAVAVLASRERAGIETFTVVFPEEDFSEAGFARETAERCGTRHQEMLLNADEMVTRLDEAIGALDQPTMDGINTYFVSWAARQAGLKVALSGLGGDELFGGYSTFRSMPRLRRMAAAARWVPRRWRTAAASAFIGTSGRTGRTDAVRKLAALWRDPDALPHPYFFSRALFTPEQTTTLLRGAGKAADSPWRMWLTDTARQAERLDRFTGVSYLELRSYLVNTLLRDTDAMSMSLSLEVRVPFLDHPLVEFVAQLPETLKRRDGAPKALLMDALGDLLPTEVAGQRKRTFTFPWERWLRGRLGEQVAMGLESLSPALEPVMNRGAVLSVWHDFLVRRTSWSRPWSLYVLNEWTRRHLQAKPEAAETGKPAMVMATGRSFAVGGYSL